MRYTYEYKRECVELYREGKWPETPRGIKEHNFHILVRRWVRIEDENGPEALKHKGSNRVWTAEDKLELVSRVIAGNTAKSIAISEGIDDGLLYQWVQKYKKMGYNGLVNKTKGRPAKESPMKKLNINNPRHIEETELEELIRLRAENEYMRAEIAVIKKEIALREEKQAALLKAKRQQSSKNSDKKGTP